MKLIFFIKGFKKLPDQSNSRIKKNIIILYSVKVKTRQDKTRHIKRNTVSRPYLNS